MRTSGPGTTCYERNSLRRLISIVFVALTACLWILTPATAREDSISTVLRSVVSVLPEWPPDETRNEEPEGSGVAVFDGLHIITALHVVDAARSIRVRTSDGQVVGAELVGRDQATDLALLRVTAALPVLAFSGDAELGGEVCAIGNAFGLGLSISCGVVSGVNRAGVGFNGIEDFVQTDAAVNPGASGGALVTRDGRLIGILSAIFTKQSDANIGVNFAVSAPLAQRVAIALRETGRVQWVSSGLRLVQALDTGETGTLGARVARVRAGSAAAEAGIEIDDVIVSVDGRRIRKPADFVSVSARLTPPGNLTVEFLRGDVQKSATIRFTE
jgi:serine protease Do